MKATSRLEDADFLEFWFLSFQLDELHEKKCSQCRNHSSCWIHEGVVYNAENVLNLCRDKRIRYIIEEMSKKDSLKHVATPEEIVWLMSKLKLNLWKKLKLKINGNLFVGYAKREGWTGKLPFYIVKCDRHNICFLDYPQGFEGYFICPLCFEEVFENPE